MRRNRWKNHFEVTRYFRVLTPALVIVLSTLAASECASGAPPTRPNILFAIADDWSYGHAGAYGCRWVKTPAFDRVAQQGILFTNAYTPNAKCAPSRSCILTGRNSWQLKAAANHIPFFPPEFKTYAEALAEHGYFVGKTAKGWAPGVAEDAAGKPRPMAGQPFDKRTAKPPASGIGASDYAGNFEDFLNAAPKNQPWCFWYGGLEPHRGYEYGSGVAKGGKKLSDIDRVPGYWPDNEIVRNDLLDYAFEVEHFDRHLGRMLELLEKRGLLDSTLVMVTSDNGMPFPHDKGQAYLDANHLPLAVMWKQGVRASARIVDDFVSFIDIAPTFIELAGLRWEQTGMVPPAGRSLTDMLFSDKAGRINPQRNHVLIGKERTDIGRPHDWGYPIRGIVKGDMLYLRNFEITRWPGGNPETGYLDCDGGPAKTEVLKTRASPALKRFWDLCFGKRPREELYDLKKDPDTLDNLAGRKEFQAWRTQLEKQLFSELKAQGDPRMSGKGKLFEQYPYADPKMRGFYERYMKGEQLRPGWVNPSDFEKPSPAASPAASSRPNIIFILADDLGYGDLGCYGQKQIRTPHLDSMAAQGMRFTDFYAGSTVCAPSRCVLMTGLHTGHAYIRGNSKNNLRPEDITAAKILRQAGYATALIGKWGLGHEGSPGVPTHQGFDYFFGYLDQTHAHNYYPSFLLRDEERVALRNVVPSEGPVGQGVASQRLEYSPDLMTSEALAFIDRNKDHPFFLYLAYTLPHANNEAKSEGMEVPDLGIYKDKDWPAPQKALAAMITRLDRDIGTLFDRLRRHGIDEQTIVFMSSDNGPHREGGNNPDFFDSNGPLRGIKRDLYEGGIRTPMIVRWPGKVAKGKVSRHVGYFADFLPTAAELAGTKAPADQDGISFLPAILGREKQQKKHPYLYWEFYEQGSAQAVRMGSWKGISKPFGGETELYDLQSDVGEQNNVAGLHPNVVSKIRAAMKEAHVPSPLWKVPAIR